MFKYLKQYRFYITLFLFLLIPIIAIDTTGRSPRDYRFYDKVVIGITAPIQSLIHWSLDLGSSIFQNYVFLWGTRRDNIELLEENRKLIGAIANLKETQQENLRLRKLLHFQELFHLDSVVARVIAKDVSPDFRAIRINRGEKHGIFKNMAVLTNEGVVGRVFRTTENTADAVTILDLYSAVDSIVERSRARGVVEGKTDDLCQLKFTLRTDDIQPDDQLVTSGLGGVFPKGIPVGTVTRVEKRQFGISQDVEVRPSINFSKLEEVMVIRKAEIVPVADHSS